METKKLESFFKGICIDAYTFFGAHKYKNGYRFSLWAKYARSVQLLIAKDGFQFYSYSMVKIDSRGIWSIVVENVEENALYKYRIEQIDGVFVDKLDPYGFYCTKPIYYGNQIIGSDFVWEDTAWLNKRDKNFDKPVNIYEIHLGSWKKQKDLTYRSIAKDLIAYVKKQGYTHIECMPLNEYPYDGSWGYQVSGYFAISNRYGSIDDFKYFVNECHNENIGVIMDFVPVHFATDDFGLHAFDGTSMYEYSKKELAYSEWGSANFDLGKEEVRSFLMSAAAYWIDEMHIDGLRMDAISNVIYFQGNSDYGENKKAIEFIQRMNTLLTNAFKGVMLIAEDSTAYPNVTKPVSEGGLGFDYKWDLGWMNDTLKYFGRDPIYRRWHHNEITFSMYYFYSEKFLLPFSHDEVVHEKGTIINKLWGSYEHKFAQLRMLYLYMYTHPGKKLNFMGNELAMFREFDEKKELDWPILKYPVHDAFHTFMKALSTIYTTYPAFYDMDYEYDSFEWIDADNHDENLFSYMRKSKEYTFVVILNMSPLAYKGHVFGVNEEGDYKELLNSEKDIYNGCNICNEKVMKASKIECNHKPYRIQVDVAPFAGIILMHKNNK